MGQADLSLRIVVNGTDHAFQREVDCSCGRCRLPHVRANTSVSLIAVTSNHEAVWHALIDVGAGVVNNLCDNLARYRSQQRVDILLLTHWHPDHTLGLNQLCESLQRSRERRAGHTLPINPIPIWCRPNTWAQLQSRHRYETERFLVPYHIPPSDANLPGQLLDPLDFSYIGIPIRITPITISHHTADFVGYCTAGFLIEGPRKRAALLWDLDSRNEWILHPTGSKYPTSIDARETQRRLQELDTLFLDCNTWHDETVLPRPTGHIGFERLQEYVRALAPRETVLIHLSGHEDGSGSFGWGWSNAVWESAAQAHWHDLPGRVVVLNPGDMRHL
jgi:beta-lactamase family protein